MWPGQKMAGRVTQFLQFTSCPYLEVFAYIWLFNLTIHTYKRTHTYCFFLIQMDTSSEKYKRVEKLKEWIHEFLANNISMYLSERKMNLLIQSVRWTLNP